MKLTHLNRRGEADMVDVGEKPVIRRRAVARGRVTMQAETLELVRAEQMRKGDVLAVARIAGINAAKKTAELIPLCHQIPLDKISIDFSIEENGVMIEARVSCQARTGVEMEALTAAAVAGLTIYDMCKAVDKTMVISEIVLLEKNKG